jgi:phosphohistidine phosphatase
MRRLIFFRHGKAEITAVSGGDKERPLAERGRVECRLAAAWLSAAGFNPDIVLVSSALRTQRTWDCVRETFPAAPVEIHDELYLAGAETIMDLIEAIPGDVETVMVLGHNPGLQDLSISLATDGDAPEIQIHRIEEGFPTAGVVIFRRSDPGPSRLEGVYEPPRAPGGPPRWVFLDPDTGVRG